VRTKRTKDYYRIQTDLHRLYYSSEIPFRYWDESPGKPSFETVVWGKKKITAEKQQSWWSKFDKGKMVSGENLILACGIPTDSLALHYIFEVCKRYVLADAKREVPQGLSVEEASSEPRRGDYQDSCPMFVLTNVLASGASRERVVSVRDWIRAHKDACRVVVVAGAPYSFCETYGVEPDVVFQFSGTTRFVRSFG
jgi:hypothetical protein